MKKFLTLLFIFLSPFIMVLLFYIASDPFKVIWHYDNYYHETGAARGTMDKDYVSTANFENRYAEQDYDSFIFGNSRSIFYQVADWMPYLASNSHAYHFDASGETLYGLEKKLAFIDSKQLKINNALLILDDELLSHDAPKTGHLYAVAPQLTGKGTYVKFHTEFLKAFISPKFLAAYLDYKISGKVKPYMTRDKLLDDNFVTYDPIINEERQDKQEHLIAEGKYYTAQQMEVFYNRDTVQQFASAVIADSHLKMLKNIKSLFDKHKTNYRIVISPLYNQKKLSAKDIAYLIQLFGRENVYDFSGINAITNDYHNYYEASHYRPHVAKEIMKQIYLRK